MNGDGEEKQYDGLEVFALQQPGDGEDLSRGDAVAPDLLISAVPAGAADFYAERTVLSPAPPIAVMDVVYHPWPTPLAEAAARAGAVVASGFDMLLHQAAAQVELMTGKPAPLEAMRAAGESELAARAPS